MTTEAWLIVGTGAALAALFIVIARSIRVELEELKNAHAELREGLGNLKDLRKPIVDRSRNGVFRAVTRKSGGSDGKVMHAVQRSRSSLSISGGDGPKSTIAIFQGW